MERFEFDMMVHTKGESCGICWSDGPKKCKCGSWLHSHFGDYTSYDSYYLEYKCENPDCPYDSYEYEDI
jgi:hypothetical protein